MTEATIILGRRTTLSSAACAKGLAKTRDQFATGVGNLLLGEKEISAEALDDLETALLTTDVGVEATRSIIDELTAQVSRKQLANMDASIRRCMNLWWSGYTRWKSRSSWGRQHLR